MHAQFLILALALSSCAPLQSVLEECPDVPISIVTSVADVLESSQGPVTPDEWRRLLRLGNAQLLRCAVQVYRARGVKGAVDRRCRQVLRDLPASEVQ